MLVLFLSPPVTKEAVGAFAFALGESLLITAMFDDDDRVVDELLLMKMNVTGNDSHPVLLYRYDSHPSCSHVSSSNYGLSVVDPLKR